MAAALQALAALTALRESAGALGGQPRVLRALAALLCGAHPPSWVAQPPRPPDKLTAHVDATLARQGSPGRNLPLAHEHRVGG